MKFSSFLTKQITLYKIKKLKLKMTIHNLKRNIIFLKSYIIVPCIENYKINIR